MHITHISLNLPLTESQIPDFKMAILGIEGLDHAWYNNKKTDKNGKETPLQRYPPIQYRVHEGYASLWGINEGAKRLEADLKKKKILTFFWNGRETTFHLVRHFSNKGEEAVYEGRRKWIRYRLQNYLPLSSSASGSRSEGTYAEYKALPTMQQKIQKLEQVLVSHLVLFSYAAGWPLQPRQILNARIVDITAITTGIYKKKDQSRTKRYMKLNMVVDINATLPGGIALGNQASLGYGVLQPFETEE